MSLDEAANRLQGAEGTSIDLGSSNATANAAVVRLVRRHVDVESVTQAKIVDSAEGIGYVQLTGFQKTSTDELEQAISGLQALGMRTSSSTSAAIRAACSTWPSRSPSDSSTRE